MVVANPTIDLFQSPEETTPVEHATNSLRLAWGVVLEDFFYQPWLSHQRCNFVCNLYTQHCHWDS